MWMKLTDEYDENVWIVNPRYKMYMNIIVNFGILYHFHTRPSSSPLFSTIRRPMGIVKYDVY